jgi:hypothetical protein
MANLWLMTSTVVIGWDEKVDPRSRGRGRRAVHGDPRFQVLFAPIQIQSPSCPRISLS